MKVSNHIFIKIARMKFFKIIKMQFEIKKLEKISSFLISKFDYLKL